MSKKPVCIGSGLVALDVVISNNPSVPNQFLAGGSCGNVITILSYLGWDCYPIARLSNNVAGDILIHDLLRMLRMIC
jgi:fructokinase